MIEFLLFKMKKENFVEMKKHQHERKIKEKLINKTEKIFINEENWKIYPPTNPLFYLFPCLSLTPSPSLALSIQRSYLSHIKK